MSRVVPKYPSRSSRRPVCNPHLVAGIGSGSGAVWGSGGGEVEERWEVGRLSTQTENLKSVKNVEQRARKRKGKKTR